MPVVVDLHGLGLKGIPIAILHDNADTTVPIEQLRRLVAVLKAARADVHFREIPEADHYGAAAGAMPRMS